MVKYTLNILIFYGLILPAVRHCWHWAVVGVIRSLRLGLTGMSGTV